MSGAGGALTEENVFQQHETCLKHYHMKSTWDSHVTCHVKHFWNTHVKTRWFTYEMTSFARTVNPGEKLKFSLKKKREITPEIFPKTQMKISTTSSKRTINKITHLLKEGRRRHIDSRETVLVETSFRKKECVEGEVLHNSVRFHCPAIISSFHSFYLL